MRAIVLIALGFAASVLDAGAASVYRCATASGVVYQEIPCDAGASERSWNADFPPANAAERERTLQREAALDARMLKRAELETSERMAREARWAREADLEAERQRSKAAEGFAYYPVYPVYPVYGSPRPVRPRPLQPSAISPSPFRW
jgi:hypothetical protein